ncbi:MAG: hypothetical protein WAL90_06790 [Desulfobacterales bacterium]
MEQARTAKDPSVKDPEIKDPVPAGARAAADKTAVTPPDVPPAEKEAEWAAAVNRPVVRGIPEAEMPAGAREEMI